MSIIAVGAIAVGTAVSVGTTLYAAEQEAQAAEKAGKAFKNMGIAGYNPLADPVLGASSLEALLGLGASNIGVGEQSNLISSVLDTASRSGQFSANRLAGIQAALGNLTGTTSTPNLAPQTEKDYKQALAMAGYPDANKFIADYHKSVQENADREERLAPVRRQIEEGRLASYTNLSQLAKDYPLATKEEILGLAQDYENQIRRKIGQDETDMRGEILQSANMMRGNPAATLGRLAQETSNQRFAAPTTALERAIQLMSARQDMGNSAITAYQALLDPARTYAYNVAGLRTTAAQNAAKSQAQQNQFQTLGVANNINAAGQARAAGIASAGQQTGSAISSLGTGYMNNQQLSGILGSSGGAGSGKGPGADTSRDQALTSFLLSTGQY